MRGLQWKTTGAACRDDLRGRALKLLNFELLTSSFVPYVPRSQGSSPFKNLIQTN